jgi:hypothetical protein
MISVLTLLRAEREEPRPRPRALVAIRDVFEREEIKFITDNDPGVRLRRIF